MCPFHPTIHLLNGPGMQLYPTIEKLEPDNRDMPKNNTI